MDRLWLAKSDSFVSTGHLDSVELTASNTIGGSRTGDDFFFLFFSENTSILGEIYW